MAKKTKSKTTVMSFRITSDEEQKLISIQDTEPAVGIQSTRQRCRKIVSDYLAGRLVYTNPDDRFADFDLLGE